MNDAITQASEIPQKPIKPRLSRPIKNSNSEYNNENEQIERTSGRSRGIFKNYES